MLFWRLGIILALSLSISACIGGGGSSTTTSPDTQGMQLSLLPSQSQAEAEAVLTVLLKDSNQQPLADTDVSLRFQNPNNATLSASSITTNAQGIGTVTVSLLILETTDIIVIAQYGTLNSSASVHFEIQSPSVEVAYPQRLDVEVDNTLLNLNDSAEIRVQLFDQNDRALAGQTLYFNTDGAANLSQNQAISDENGQVSLNISDNLAENITLTVQAGELSQALALYFGANLQLSPNQQNALAQTELTAILKDAEQSPLIGQTLTFNFIGNNQASLEPATIETGSDGSAKVNITDIAGSGGDIQVQVKGGQLRAQALIQFLANTGEGTQLSLNSDKRLLQAGQTAHILAQLQDSQGLAIVAKPIRFFIDDQFYSEVLTDRQGQALLALNSEAANISVRAESGAATQTLLLYFDAQLSLVAQNSQALADGADSIDLQIRLSDYQARSIAGATVYFQVAQGNAELDKFSAITDEAGQARLSVRSNEVNSPLIQAQVDGIPSAEISLNFVNENISQQAARLILSSPLPIPINLSLNGNASLQIKVEDNQGIAIAGVPVQLLTTGIGTVTDTVTTDQNGLANATFSAGSQAGLSSVIASYNNLSAELSIRVQPGEAGTLEVLNIEPADIGIIGSGQTQTSNIQFILKDIRGNPVADGTQVNFSLGSTTLGGGEQIFTDNNQGTQVTALTVNGIAGVSLRSGLVAGTIDIIASSGDISSLARVSIIGGLPDADHLSIAAEFLNIAGGRDNNLEDLISVQLADRFGNTVASQTPVNFISEGGVIGLSQNAGGFNSSSERGQITALLRSSEPTTPNLGGIEPKGNLGLNRLVAYTTGSESFHDNNGNGFYDNGDSFSQAGFIDDNNDNRWNPGERITAHGDMSEPFIDGNDNQIFENGEFYIDVNGNGQFDGPDGIYQANTTIWRSMNILFSSTLDTAHIISCPSSNITASNAPSSISIPILLRDTIGNALVSGTQFSTSLIEGAENAILTGTTRATLGDTQSLGFINLLTLSGRKLNTENVINKNVSVTLKITLTPPIANASQGRNFEQTLEYNCAVIINTEVAQTAENTTQTQP